MNASVTAIGTAARPAQNRITKAERTTLAALLAIDPASITKENVEALREQAKATDPTEDETAPAAPKPGLLTAQFDLEAVTMVLRQPSVTLPDGTVVSCPHTAWGHQTEAAAKACARKLAADNGAKLAASSSAS